MTLLVQSDIVTFYDAGTSGGTRPDIAGGLYVWENDSSNFNSATISLQSLGADGATWKAVTTATTNAPQQIHVSAGASMRVTVSGSPTALYSRMSRVPV